MEEENKKMEEEIKNEEPKQKSHKVFAIVIIVIACALIFGSGIILGQKLFEGNKENKNTAKEDKNTNNIVDNNTINDNTNQDVEININDEIKEIYNKYHSEENPVQLSGNSVENDIYNVDMFTISDIKSSDVPNSYAEKILTQVAEKLNLDNNNKKVSDDKIKNVVKEMAIAFFGKNFQINDGSLTMGSWGIEYEDGKYIARSGGGDTSDIYATYKLTKAEKDDNNLYLYEDVTVNDETESKTTEYSYKWTYDLQDDGNYYFLRAERVK